MTTTFERPADEIQAGDVIEYAPGGLMLVTIPGQPETVRFSGRRVGHHGVTLTAADGDRGAHRTGRAMSTLHTPRAKVSVHEQRAYRLGDGCPCHFHREKRGETGPAALPPVLGESGALAAAPVEADAAVSAAAPVTASARVRRRRGGELTRGGVRRELPAGAERLPEGARVPFELARRAAPLLGEGWSAKGPAYEGEKAAYLVHADGRTLKIEPDDRPAQRNTHVRVTVKYPADAPVRIWPVHQPETRFRHDRPVSGLVAQLRKHVFPVYDEKFPEIQARTEEYRRAKAAGDSFSALIACMVPGGEVSEHDSARVTAYPVPGHIEKMSAYVSTGDSLHRVAFDYVDTETLEALVQTYAALTKAKRERRAAAAGERAPAVR